MDETGPAAFYTGLVAELYAPLRSTDPDPEPYAHFIAAVGGPTLELGCGDGDPLLALVARGLDVEGLDSSADMLGRCRARAAGQGLAVTLHEAAIEAMDLGRTYRSMFLAGPTFNLLPDDATVAAALARMHAHLEPGGAALVPLFIPAPDVAGPLGRTREAEVDGATLRFTPVSTERDEEGRRQTSVLRYERIGPDRTETVERSWVLHWHTQDGFRRLATAAGFEVAAVLSPAGGRAEPDADQFAFVLTRPA